MFAKLLSLLRSNYVTVPYEEPPSPRSRRPLLAASDDELTPSTTSLVSDEDEIEDERAPMDHGIDAWFQVLGGFLLQISSWGLSNAFVVFQAYYSENLLSTHSAPAISWIGSIQLFLTTVGSLPGGVLIDRGYLGSLIAVGTAIQLVGLTMTSFSTGYWPIFFWHGICVGVGSGILGVISVAVIVQWFESKRMLATGLTTTGASFAGIVFPILLRKLLSTVGFEWSIRILVGFILLINSISFLVLQLRRPQTFPSLPNVSDTRFSLRHFKDKAYTIFVIAFTLLMASTYIPFFYVTKYAIALNVAEATGTKLLVLMNGANLLGRIIPSLLADRYGGLNALIILVLLSSIPLFGLAMPFAGNLAMLITFTAIYGFLSGPVIVLLAPTIATLSPDPAQVGTRMGLAYAVAAFGGLAGNPIAGALKGDGKNGSVQQYRGVWLMAAVTSLAGVVALIMARKHKVGGILKRARI